MSRELEFISQTFGHDFFDKLKTYISQERIDHSLRLIKTACELNKNLGLNLSENKIYTAGLLHDITKELDREAQLNIIQENKHKRIFCTEINSENILNEKYKNI